MSRRMPQNSGKSPSFQFYYKDWLGDQRLKRASKKAKGVWIDLICCSMDMPTPGVFADGNDGKTPLKRREINAFLTGNRRENRDGFAELIRRGIIKQREDGAFYVKRIQRDMELRRIRQEAGRKGGNPDLVNQNRKQTSNQNPTPSTSSSTSVNKYRQNSVEFRLAALLLDLILQRKPDFREGQDSRREKTLQRWAVHVDRMVRLDNRKPERIEAVVRWCQADAPSGERGFGWQDNILSTAKLREKFDRLELAMGRSQQDSQPRVVEFEGSGPSREFLQKRLDDLLRIPECDRTAKDREDIDRLEACCNIAEAGTVR